MLSGKIGPDRVEINLVAFGESRYRNQAVQVLSHNTLKGRPLGLDLSKAQAPDSQNQEYPA